jgi:hypothetical protein
VDAPEAVTVLVSFLHITVRELVALIVGVAFTVTVITWSMGQFKPPEETAIALAV